MTVEIKDKERYYMIKNVKWVNVKDGNLVVNYIGDDNELHEEIGPMPDYMRAMDCE